MKVVFMGTPDFSVGTLEALVEAGYEITGVVTQPDKPKGRGKQMMPTPVKEAAEKHGLPVYQPRRVRDAEAIEKIREMEPDVIVVVAFGQIITKEILEMPKYGCINVHASLLPAYRGAAPIQWAVMNGDQVSGVTIMKMDEGIDTGEMLSKWRFRLHQMRPAAVFLTNFRQPVQSCWWRRFLKSKKAKLHRKSSQRRARQRMHE